MKIVSAALLGLVGGEGLISKCGALAVLPQQLAHLVQDCIDLAVARGLQILQLRRLAHDDGQFAGLGLLIGRQSVVFALGGLDGAVQSALGAGLDSVELVDEILQLNIVRGRRSSLLGRSGSCGGAGNSLCSGSNRRCSALRGSGRSGFGQVKTFLLHLSQRGVARDQLLHLLMGQGREKLRRLLSRCAGGSLRDGRLSGSGSNRGSTLLGGSGFGGAAGCFFCTAGEEHGCAKGQCGQGNQGISGTLLHIKTSW